MMQYFLFEPFEYLSYWIRFIRSNMGNPTFFPGPNLFNVGWSLFQCTRQIVQWHNFMITTSECNIFHNNLQHSIYSSIYTHTHFPYCRGKTTKTGPSTKPPSTKVIRKRPHLHLPITGMADCYFGVNASYFSMYFYRIFFFFTLNCTS